MTTTTVYLHDIYPVCSCSLILVYKIIANIAVILPVLLMMAG